MKNIKTTRFGEIVLEKNRIVRFANGLPGFEDEKEFALLLIDETSPYIFMQSAQTPDLAFLLTRPFLFFPDYEFHLSDDVTEALGVKSEDDIDVFVLVIVPGGDIKKLTANLLAPVVVNKNTGAAQQVVLEKTSYTTKHPLFDKGAK